MSSAVPTPVAETATPTVTWGQLAEAALWRLVLPAVVIALVLWDAVFFINSWCLTPANDFGRMFASAELFTQGRDMYAWTRATPAWLEENYRLDLYNMNPPHWHLLLLPLTLLPGPDHAFALWWVVSAVCLCQCVRWVLEETKVTLTAGERRLALLALLACSGTAAMLYTGQLSFLLLVPITRLWLAARRGEWARAGVMLGLALSVKPFLGVVLAWLVWRRRWKAAAYCLLTCVLCFAFGLAVFGWDNHASWVARMRQSEGWAWLPLNASLLGALTRTFTESVWFVPVVALPARAVWLVWVGVGGALGLLTLLASGRGDRPESVDQDLGLVLVASVFFCPLGWIYYVWLALPPLVALLARGWFYHTGPGETARRLRWPLAAVVLMVVAFAWPTVGTRLFQPEYIGSRRPPELGPVAPGWPMPPQALATLTIGNVYFLGLFALWACLVASGFALKRRQAAPALAPLAPADYRVSVVMPVFSETDTVRLIADWLVRELGDRLHEIVIVQSPRSSPESREVCRRLAADYPQVGVYLQRDNPGLGRGVREGFARVTGNVVLMIDSDNEMEIDTVPRLLAEMARGGHGMVSASRWLPGGGFSGYARGKYCLNWCFQQMFRCLFLTRLTDLTYGFKLLRAELVRGVAWEGTLHEIACETTLKPVRLGVSVGEVPTRWTARTQGVSKNSFWRNFRYVRMAASVLWRGVPFAPTAAPQPPQPAVPDRQADGFGSGQERPIPCAVPCGAAR